MSSSDPVKAPKEKKRGLSKYVMKMKNVFRDSQQKRKSDVPIAARLPAQSSVIVGTQDITSITASAEVGQSDSTKLGLQSRQDRVRILAQKYGIDTGSLVWKESEAGLVDRVEKPIRMRVHRSCHKCGTMFGAGKLCASCGHVRCTGCPRYPKKKSAAKGQADEVSLVTMEGPVRAHVDRHASKAIEGPKTVNHWVLTMPSKTGGQDLVRKKPKQRIRRTCHCCQEAFRPGCRECSSCGHIRCWDCPRDPPKLEKYPNGYPGDAQPDPEPGLPTDRPQRIVHHICHVCKTTFRTDDTKCPSCSHERCVECPKMPPKKVKPLPDPEIVKRVQQRLASMSIDSKGP